MPVGVNQLVCGNGHVFDIEGTDTRPPEEIATLCWCLEEMAMANGLIQTCGARIVWRKYIKPEVRQGGIVFTRNGLVRTMPRGPLDNVDQP